MITITHYLVLSALLFGISAMGIFMNRKNVLILLMSIELMVLAVTFNFISFSRYRPGDYWLCIPKPKHNQRNLFGMPQRLGLPENRPSESFR